jgi:hypothetical protein
MKLDDFLLNRVESCCPIFTLAKLCLILEFASFSLKHGRSLTHKERVMTEMAIEKSKLKPVILEVLNDLFNLSDIEEAKRTPIGRLISPEAKIETLTTEVRHLESSMRAEMKAMEKTFEAGFEQLGSRLAFQEKLQYLVLAAVVGGLIKVVFFP